MEFACNYRTKETNMTGTPINPFYWTMKIIFLLRRQFTHAIQYLPMRSNKKRIQMNPLNNL